MRMEAAAGWRGVRGAVGAASFAVLVLAVFFGGGSDDARLVWVAAVAFLAVAAALAAAALGRGAWPRGGVLGGLLVAFLGAGALWSGLSIAWSLAPDRSWAAFNRGLVYVALVLLGAFVGALIPRAPRAAAVALAVVFGAAIAWALAGKIAPALGPDMDVERSARLRSPVGYWNALALLVSMSLPLWLWLAARRELSAVVRAGAVAALAASLVALALTASRGGILVAFVAVVAWLALVRALEGPVALAIASVVAVPLAAWALSRSGIADAGVVADLRERDGVVFGVLLLVALAVVFGVSLVLAREETRRPLERDSRRRLARALAAAGAAAALLVLVVGAIRVGDPREWAAERWDEFTNPPAVQVAEESSRIASFSSNNRWTWWTEAWRIFEAHPGVGTGASSFELARRPIRTDPQQPLAPHNLGLQALSETGLIGFALLLGAVVAAAAVVASALRRLDAADRAAAAALAAALVAYLAHSLIDIGWEFVAVSAPAFLVLGVLASAGRRVRESRERRPLWALAAVVAALAALASVASPALAERRVDGAVDAFADGDLRAAADAARSAQELNPLSIEPLHLRASVLEAQGARREAQRLYVDAVNLQPENPETWFELGRFQYEVRGDFERAFAYLDRAYAIDRLDVDTGLWLDEVRAAMEARGPAPAPIADVERLVRAHVARTTRKKAPLLACVYQPRGDVALCSADVGGRCANYEVIRRGQLPVVRLLEDEAQCVRVVVRAKRP